MNYSQFWLAIRGFCALHVSKKIYHDWRSETLLSFFSAMQLYSGAQFFLVSNPFDWRTLGTQCGEFVRVSKVDWEGGSTEVENARDLVLRCLYVKSVSGDGIFYRKSLIFQVFYVYKNEGRNLKPVKKWSSIHPHLERINSVHFIVFALKIHR